MLPGVGPSRRSNLSHSTIPSRSRQRLRALSSALTTARWSSDQQSTVTQAMAGEESEQRHNVLVMCGLSGRDPIETIDPQFYELLAGMNVYGIDEATDPATRIDGVLSLAHAPVTRELMESIGPSTVKIVSNYGSGVEHIDLGDLRERAIPVANLRALPELTEATADCAFALLMASSPCIVENNE